MAYCKKFIDGINAINFSEKSAEIIKNALIASAYKELKKESELLTARAGDLPKSIDDNVAANEQLAEYKLKLKGTLAAIALQMKALREAVPDVNLEAPIAMGDPIVFVDAFAKNFRNIRHLADTLSDAPDTIKNLQTQLYNLTPV